MDTVCSRQARTSLHYGEVGGEWREVETLFLLMEGREEDGREGEGKKTNRPRAERTELTLAFGDSSRVCMKITAIRRMIITVDATALNLDCR